MRESAAPPKKSADEQGLRLVFGASGYIGSHLVPYLLARGIPVRAASRRPEILQARQWRGVETCGADALEPAHLVIFKGLTREISRLAEALEAAS